MNKSNNTLRRALKIGSVLTLPVLTGCVLSLRPYNQPSREQLQVQSAAPTNYVLRVAEAQRFAVAADGRVVLDVPRLHRGCDAHLFGFIKLQDGNPENIPAIEVLRGDTVVRRLSLTKLRALPMDAEGYHLLILK